MANQAARTVLTHRDHELLAVLARGPHDTNQLLTISQRFQNPFTDITYLRKRLSGLTTAGWIRSWPYATTGPGVLRYFKLTRNGWLLLFGDAADMPPRSFFESVPLASQPHIRSLADFIIHTDVAARRSDVTFTDFFRDGEVQISVNGSNLIPDAGFTLVEATGRRCNFLVELDNSTERIRTQKHIESWTRKIDLYDALQYQTNERFRLLIVACKSRDRVANVLRFARQRVRNAQRTLCSGVFLDDYLHCTDPLARPVFVSQLGRETSLLAIDQSHCNETNRPSKTVHVRSGSDQSLWLPSLAA